MKCEKIDELTEILGKKFFVKKLFSKKCEEFIKKK